MMVMRSLRVALKDVTMTTRVKLGTGMPMMRSGHGRGRNKRRMRRMKKTRKMSWLVRLFVKLMNRGKKCHRSRK